MTQDPVPQVLSCPIKLEEENRINFCQNFSLTSIARESTLEEWNKIKADDICNDFIILMNDPSKVAETSLGAKDIPVGRGLKWKWRKQYH